MCKTIGEYAYAFNVDENGNMYGEWITDSFLKTFGYTIKDIDDMGGWMSIVCPEDLPIALEHARKVISGKPDISIFRFVTRDGKKRWLRDYAVPVFDDAGIRVVKIYGSSVDLTEMFEREEKINELLKIITHYVDSSPTVIYVLKLVNGKMVPHWISGNITEKFGYSIEEALNPDWWFEHLHPEERCKIIELQGKLIQEGHLIYEYRFFHNDGSIKWIRDELRTIKDENKKIIEIIGAWTDITERKLLEESLNKERELLSVVMNASPVGIALFDKECRIAYANQVFREILDLLDYEGFHCIDVFFKSYDLSKNEIKKCIVSSIIDTAKPIRFLQVAMEKENSKKIFNINGVPILDKDGEVNGVVMIFMDITEHKKLEEQYLQVQKLESLGRLSAGIAHDFNNIIGAIIGFTELALMKLAEEHPSVENLRVILSACDKAKMLIRQLLTFSKKQISNLEVFNLNEVIIDLRKMLVRVIGEDIKLITNLNEPLYLINADKSNIEQVIMNLVVNARDAMPDGGELFIETRNIDFNQNESITSIPSEKYVLLTIKDTGVGMSKEVKEHIFEPFFTTKPAGEGTGLGLATVYGIIKQLNGYIEVYSELGKGTEFKIYIPAAKDLKVDSKKEKSLSNNDIAYGSENIVIIEDNDDVRTFLEIALQNLGFSVKSFLHPLKALEYILNSGDDINLVITDVVMPELDGFSLYQKVKEKKGNIKFLFTTGYSYDFLTQKGLCDEKVQLLKKPFTLNVLSKKIREVLGDK